MPVTLFAQLTDDFEDADITNWTQSTADRWAASDISPLNGSFSLHHVFDNPDGDHDQVSFDIPTLDLNADITTWRFKIKYNYNPSDGNNWNVFLVSDVDAGLMIPGEDVNGYVLGVNYTGYDDMLKLLKITSGTADVVITSTLNWDLNTEPSDTIALEITRSATGLWEVLYNADGDFSSLASIGTGTDNTYTKANYFGVYYEYTSSADRLLWLDDIEIIGEIYVDNDPPVVDSLYVLSSNNLKIEFSEKVDSAIAVNPLNYTVDEGIGNPDAVIVDALYLNAELFFNQKFTDSQLYAMDIQSVEDLNGNAIKDTTVTFMYEYIKPISLELISANELQIQFSRLVDTLSAQDANNYSLDNGAGNPTIAEVVAGDSTIVQLQFGSDFINKTEYNLSIQNVADRNLDSLQTEIISFTYFVPELYDIVINEIMADPDPVVSLPNIEYLEIYNTSEFDINISGWTFKSGTYIRNFPSLTVKSNEYYIVCDEDDEAEFTSFGNVITVDGSLSLTNSGQTLIIRNESGGMISRVIYSEDWYQDDYKMEGGWSLEQIDPLNPCGEENNWKASESGTGGTPGQENSVYASNPDLDAPELSRITVINENSIQLFFNESLESLSAMQTEIYSVDQGIGNPISVNLIAPDNKSLTLDFANSFSTSLVYTLEISGGITDCTGNEIADKNSARFAIPVDFEENDVVINEILFNPLPDGSDFIEVYNRSDKTFDIKDLRIATLDIETGEYSGIEHIINDGFLIFPGDYLVVTENASLIKEQYYTSNPDGFIDMDLPTMNDNNGIVLLLNKSLTIIDKLAYDEDMQFPLLATDEGVSLERINYNRSSVDKTNWHSASELAGFATPAYENSQFLDEEDIVDEVNVVPEVFSPDNDGFEDVTNITFLLDEPGYVANIKIFDSKGRIIRYLANNQLLGIEGVITWDGLDDKNQKAPIGIYVVYIEIFDLDGNVKQFKKSVVVAARL